jgi:hypothetical protein
MSTFAKYFDRTAVISLPGRDDRRARLLANLRECGLADSHELVWTDAVDGRKETPPTWWQQGPGAWGCRASHLAVLRAARRDNCRSLLILEDDACFHPRAALWLEMLMPALPGDWDIFFLGGQHMAEPATTADPRLLRGTRITRTHAWAIHARAFDRLIAAIEDIAEYEAHPSWHVDHQIALGMESGRWTAYAPAWWLAGQDEGHSDIATQSYGRRWWPPGRDWWLLPFVQPNAPDLAGSDMLFHLEPPEGGLPESPIGRALFLRHAAWEAWQRGRLPVCDLSSAEVLDIWPAGLRTVTSLEELSRLADYPANGLFPHSFSSALSS